MRIESGSVEGRGGTLSHRHGRGKEGDDGQLRFPKPWRAGAGTIPDILRDVEPMGDLARFEIDDLTPDDEDEFFGILDGA